MLLRKAIRAMVEAPNGCTCRTQNLVVVGSMPPGDQVYVPDSFRFDMESLVSGAV